MGENMANDTTGMKGAQGGDQHVKRAGRVKRGLKKAGKVAGKGAEFVPFTPQRRRMKIREQAGIQAETMGAAMSKGVTDGNQALIQALKESGDVPQEGAEAARAVDTGMTPRGKGDIGKQNIHELNMEMISAIRQGQRRTDSDIAVPMRIREVVCKEQVIEVIENGSVLTPIEEVDTAFATRMEDIRERLAAELARGAVEEFSAEKMDILYTTLAGMKYLRDEEGDVIYHTDDNGKPITDEQGHKIPRVFWSKEAWPHDIPHPPEALLNFVEGVAQRKHANQEGEFIGGVLKGLTESRTVCTVSQEEALKYLVDRDYVDEYLERRSAGPIDKAVENFTGFIMEILLTPAHEMAVLKLEAENYRKVPGFGICRIDEVDTARSKVAEVTRAERDIEKAGADGEKITASLGTIASAKENVSKEFEAAKKAASEADKRCEDIAALKEAVAKGEETVPQDELDAEERNATQQKERSAENLGRIQATLENIEDTEKTVQESNAGVKRELQEKTAELSILTAELAAMQATEVAQIHETSADDVMSPESEEYGKIMVPGVGYYIDVEGFGPCKVENVSEAYVKMERLEEAAGKVENAAEEAGRANEILERVLERKTAAQEELTNAREAVTEANAKKQKVEVVRQGVADGTVKISKAQLQKEEAAADKEKAAADQRLQDAEQDLANIEAAEGTARGQKSTADRVLGERTAEHDALKADFEIMQTAEGERFEELVVHYSNEFRAMILEGTEISESMINDLAQKMDQKLPNLTVLELVEDAKDLLDVRDVSQQYVPEQETIPIKEEDLNKALIDGKIKQETYDAFMEKLKKRAEEEKLNPFLYKKEEFEDKVKAFKDKVNRAVLPEEVKVRLNAVADAMKAKRYYLRPDLETELTKIEDDNAYPLRQAAKVSVEELNKKTPEKAGKIADAQFIIARMIYEAHKKELDPLSSTREGSWEKLKNKVMWVFTKEFWVGRRKKDREPGEERGGVIPVLYRNLSIKQTYHDLRPSNFKKKLVGRNPKTRKPHRYRWYTRGMRGIWQGTLKGMFIVGAVIAVNNAPANPDLTRHWYSFAWPGNWNNTSYYINHFFRAPWDWWKPITPELPRKRIIDDSYDIPSRLVHRPAKYYTQAYNVTTDDRLEWLKENAERFPVKTVSKEEWGTLKYFRGSSGGVLRYLQEHTTLQRVVSIEDLPQDPRTLSRPRRGGEAAKKQAETVEPTKVEKQEAEGEKPDEKAEEQKPEEGLSWYEYIWPGNWFGSDEEGEEEVDEMLKERDDFKLMRQYGQTLPESCKALGIDAVTEDPKTPEDENDIQEYQPLTRTLHGGREYDAEEVDRWEPGYPFACTLALDAKPLEDNFVINKAKANEFVDYLRVQEKNGAHVNYSYMVKNTAHFVQKGFLVTKTRSRVMEDFRIAGLGAVDMVTAQDPKRMRRLILQPLVHERTVGEGIENARRSIRGHTVRFLEGQSEEPEAMSTAAQQFYEGQSEFHTLVNDTIENLYQNQERHGEIVRAAYGGDREKTEQAIRGELYRMLTAEDQESNQDRRNYGLKARLEGGQLIVEITGKRIVDKAERIESQHRDAFLQSMENKINTAHTDLDPRRDRLEDADLEVQFNAALALGRTQGWVVDITDEYKRDRLIEQLSELRLSEETAYTLLSPTNERIRNLLEQFAGSETYRLKVTMLDDFIKELLKYQRAGGDVNDYSPFGDAMGKRAAWAIDAGYIVEREVFHGVGTSATGEGTPASQIKRFYEGEGTFNGLVNGTIERLFADEGRDGELAKGAYDGDQEKTKQAIREELYGFLTADDTRSAQKRKGYGLEVSTEGGELKVEVTDRKRARKSINNHVVKFLREKGE